MQQIDITRQVLLDFAEEYIRVPDVEIGNPYKVKAQYPLLVAWLAVLVADVRTTDLLSVAFTGWLAGRNEFVLMDECQQDFATILVALCNEVLDVKAVFHGT